MRIASLQLRNFRCFNLLNLDFDNPVILIVGPNGTGKTSILEALHYACYLKSFKTHLAKELVQLESLGFAVSTNIVSSGTLDSLNIGFGQNKRSVKLNQKAIGSYKELIDIYKVVTITEDDLQLVQGAPSLRRSFIDQMITLIEPTFSSLLKKYKQILDNRNALLYHYKGDLESYLLWTDQLIQVCVTIQKQRIHYLSFLESKASSLSEEILGPDYNLLISYQYAIPYTNIWQCQSAQEIVDKYPNLLQNELAQRRTLFGAHLDDYKIIFQNKSSRIYASRGQQKLIVILLKLAQTKSISDSALNTNPILLVDDFITDLDAHKINILIPLMIKSSSQLIITTPLSQSFLEEKLSAYNPQIITL